MRRPARRYDAIRRIVELCSSSEDTDTILRNILVVAESIVPDTHLEFLLLTNDSQRHICSDLKSVCERRGEPYVLPLGVCNGVSGALISSKSDLRPPEKNFLQSVVWCVSTFIAARTAQAMPADNLGKRIEEISAVYEINQALDTASTDELLRLITEKAAQVMDAQACSLMLKDPQRDELVIKASYGLSEDVVDQTRLQFGEGVAGKVAQTGEPMLLTNLEEDPRFEGTGVVSRPDIVSSICVPLHDEDGRVQGVLSIRRRAPAPMFVEKDVEIFSVFASQVALAISNARLYSSLKERVQELSMLYEASQELSSASSLEDAAHALVRVATRMAGSISTMLVLLDTKGTGVVQAASGVPPALCDRVGLSLTGRTVAWLKELRATMSFSIDTKRLWPAPMRPLLAALKDYFTWVNILPLVAEDNVLGILLLGHQGDRLPDQRRVRLLSIVSSQAATIIKNASQYEEKIGQKVLELSALYELSERISTAGSLEEALDSVLRIVRDIVWYDDSFISTVDYERKVMIVQAARGQAASQIQGKELSFEEDALSSLAIQERKALLSGHVDKDPKLKFSSISVRSPDTKSLMAIPLIVHDEIVGVLNVHAKTPNLYTEEHVRILSIIASQAAALYKELEALSALASYTDDILRSIAAGVFTIDRDGRVLTWNKAAEDIMHVPTVKAVGLHLLELLDAAGFSENDKNCLLSVVDAVVRTGESYLGYKQQFHPISGSTLYLNLSIAQLRDRSGDTLGVVIIVEDVTKQAQMENEMVRIAELASIGQLAATIAHELRNPLSSIKGAAQYLRNEYADHTAVCEFLDIIVDEVNVLNRVTTEFLDFARPVKLNLHDADLNDILFRTLQFMDVEITRQKVQVVQDFSYDIPTIKVDDRQLEQVFRNLILNALQAMPTGGTITLHTDVVRDNIRVAIIDSGIGIPPDQLDRIFVPFFTTKTKGTGLGLSIVKKIVENHGGSISVESTVGKGTTFEILLPVTGCKTPPVQSDGSDAENSDFLRRAFGGSYDAATI